MDPQCHYHRILYLGIHHTFKTKQYLLCRVSLASSFSNSYSTILLRIMVFIFAFASLTRCAFAPQMLWTSPRTISTIQLHMLPHFHLWPIYQLVFLDPYFFRMGNLVLKGASRLDAFSVYPVRTWLPCYALGRTTGAPAVRPSRSSRTKDSSPQISYARDR